MKRLLMIVLALLGTTSSVAFGSTTLTINTSDFTGANPVTSIRIDLQNCANARLSGTGQIVPQTQTITPVAGVAHITLFSNTDPANASAIILCQTPSGQQAVSYYSFSFIFQGVITGVGSYNLTPGTFNLSALTPCVGPACIGNGSGGVTRIIAGQNITISPTNGLGQVTINTIGGGGAGNPAAPGGTFQVGNVDATQFISSGVKQANQFDTGGGGNGITNAFGSTTNQLVIVDNGETDTASIGQPLGSVILDRRATTGSFGTRSNNCVNVQGGGMWPAFAPFGIFAQNPCDGLINYQTTSIGHGGAGPESLSINSYAEGYGYNVGDVGELLPADELWTGSNGGRVAVLSFSPGLTNVFNIFGSCYKAGDCNILTADGFSDGGYFRGADQGMTFQENQGGETPSILSTTVATTTGTGDIKPTFGTLNGSAHWTPGLYAIDVSHTIATGTVSSNSSYFATGITVAGISSPGSGMTPGMYALICSGGGGTGFAGVQTIFSDGVAGVVPTITASGHGYTSDPTCTISAGGTPPVIGGSRLTNLTLQTVAGASLSTTPNIGILNTYMAKAPVDNVNVTTSVTVAVQSGTFTSGSVVWVASNATPEMCFVASAGSVTSGVQTVGLSCNLPHAFGSMIFQGGTNGFESFDADSNAGWPIMQFYYASLSSTQIVVGNLVKGTQADGGYPHPGGQHANFGAGFNGVHFYKGALTLPTDAFSFGGAVNNGANFGVNDTPWTVGDTIIVPHWAFAMAGLAIDISAFSPPSTGSAGATIVYHGQHVSSPFVGLQVGNGNPFGWYLGCDSTSTQTCLPVTGTQGWLNGQDAIQVTGAYNRGIEFAGPPIPGGAIFQVFDTGTTPKYGFLSSNSNAGALLVDQPNSRWEFSSALLVDGPLIVSNTINTAAGATFGGQVVIGNPTFGLHIPAIQMQTTLIAVGSAFANGLQWTQTGNTQQANILWNINSGPSYEMYFQIDNSLANVLTLHSDLAGHYTSTFLGTLDVGGAGSLGLMQLNVNLFSALPTCNGGQEGSMAPVSDSTTATWGATISGSGTNHVMAYCDNSAWTVMGK